MKSIIDLKKMEEKDILKELSNAQRDVMKLKFEAKTGQLSGAHKLQRAKKYIAQIKTVQRARRAEQATKGEIVEDKSVADTKVETTK